MDDGISTDKSLTKVVQRLREPRPFQSPAKRIDPQHKNARHGPILTEYQLSEVLVFRQQDPIILDDRFQDIAVGKAALLICHVTHVMTSAAKLCYQQSVDAFVGEKPHRTNA